MVGKHHYQNTYDYSHDGSVEEPQHRGGMIILKRIVERGSKEQMKNTKRQNPKADKRGNKMAKTVFNKDKVDSQRAQCSGSDLNTQRYDVFQTES